MTVFDTPKEPQCTSVPVSLQVNRDPNSMPKNYRMFLAGEDGKETRVHMDISRNVRRSATLMEILELSVEGLVADPNLKRDSLSGDLVFTTDLEDAGEIQDLVDDVNREFNYKRAMLKADQQRAKQGPQQTSNPLE